MVFRITPHQISVCLLIHAYIRYEDTLEDDSVSANDSDEWMRIHLKTFEMTRAETRALVRFILGEIENVTERSFHQFVACIRSYLVHDKYPVRQLVQFLYQGTRALVHSPDDLCSFLSSAKNLLTRPIVESGSTVRPDFIAAESALGLYVRRFVLAYEKMSFSSVSRLFEDVASYVKESEDAEGPFSYTDEENDPSPSGGRVARSTIAMDTNEEAATEKKQSNSVGESVTFGGGDERALPLSKLSRAQLQVYLEKKLLNITRVVGTGKNHPGVTQAEISTLLKIQPHLPQAYLFRYMNCVASQNFTGALDALHRYFDYALCFGRGASSVGVGGDGRFRLQYASLNLAILHFRFGHVAEAYIAIQETIRVAQQHGDSSCIARALFWLYHVANSTHRGRAISLLRRCRMQANALGLHSLERLAALNLAERCVSRPSRRPESSSQSVESSTARASNACSSAPPASQIVWSAIRADPSMNAADSARGATRRLRAPRATVGDATSGEASSETKMGSRVGNEVRTADEPSLVSETNDAHAISRSLLLRAAVWEAYGNSALSRDALSEHVRLAGRCDANATCFALCKIATLPDITALCASKEEMGAAGSNNDGDAETSLENDYDLRSCANGNGDDLSAILCDTLKACGPGDSTHTRTLRSTLRARYRFPHAPSVPSLAWPRTLCLALFRRSLLRGEWNVAEMTGLQLTGMSLPSSTTAGHILAHAKKNASAGGRRRLLRVLLPTQSSSSDSDATIAMFIESCYCSVRLVAEKRRWEDAIETIETLVSLCEAFDLLDWTATLLCEAGRVLLRSAPTQPATALRPLLKAFALYTRMNRRLSAANCAVLLADLHLRLGKVDSANSLLREHIPIVLQNGSARDRGF
eukprot:g4691.t1